MKLIIDISEDLKEVFVNQSFIGSDCFEMGEVLEKGIPVQNKESESISNETTIAMLLEIQKTDAEIRNELEEKVEIQEEIIEKQKTEIGVQDQSIEIQKKVIEKQKELIQALKEMCFEEM